MGTLKSGELVSVWRSATSLLFQVGTERYEAGDFRGALANDQENEEALQGVERIQRAYEAKEAAASAEPTPEPAPAPAPAPQQ